MNVLHFIESKWDTNYKVGHLLIQSGTMFLLVTPMPRPIFSSVRATMNYMLGLYYKQKSKQVGPKY